MTSLTFLIGTRNRPHHLRALLSALVIQSRGDWRALVLDEGFDPDGPDDPVSYAANDVVRAMADHRIEWRGCGPWRQDWHQTVRAELAETLAGTAFLAFTPDDAYYAPRFVEFMVGACESQHWSLAYCDWVYDQAGYATWLGTPVVGRIDVGGFIVSKQAFDAVGWPWRDHEGDGKFVRAVCDAGFSHGRVAHTLYVKN